MLRDTWELRRDLVAVLVGFLFLRLAFGRPLCDKEVIGGPPVTTRTPAGKRAEIGRLRRTIQSQSPRARSKRSAFRVAPKATGVDVFWVEEVFYDVHKVLGVRTGVVDAGSGSIAFRTDAWSCGWSSTGSGGPVPKPKTEHGKRPDRGSRGKAPKGARGNAHRPAGTLCAGKRPPPSL